MGTVLAVTCALALQQLHAAPLPTHVGAEVVVTASGAAGPLEGVRVEVELPGGVRQPVGVTGADGGLRFTPEAVGLHAFAASIDGTRCVVPVAVGPERRRWLLGLACVPLGVALLVALLRRASTRR